MTSFRCSPPFTSTYTLVITHLFAFMYVMCFRYTCYFCCYCNKTVATHFWMYHFFSLFLHCPFSFFVWNVFALNCVVLLLLVYTAIFFWTSFSQNNFFVQHVFLWWCVWGLRDTIIISLLFYFVLGLTPLTMCVNSQHHKYTPTSLNT